MGRFDASVSPQCFRGHALREGAANRPFYGQEVIGRLARPERDRMSAVLWEAEENPLVLPIKRQAGTQHETFGIEFQRLATIEDGGRDVGREVGQSDHTGEVAPVHVLFPGEVSQTG